MIRHTVVFALVHPRGSAQEAAFLADARVLASVPGVRRFEQLAQVSPESGSAFGFFTEFDDRQQYAAHDAHPDHAAFVRGRWATEVAQFQELDFEVLDAGAAAVPA